MQISSFSMRAPQWFLVLAGMTIAGCGPSGAADRSHPPIPPEAVGTQSSALMPGATNVTNGKVSGSAYESETAIDTAADKVVIAYNIGDSSHVGGAGICQGYTGEGFAYASTSDTSSWATASLFVPFGFAALVGDPSVAGVTMSSTVASFYIASLAMTNGRWRSLMPDAMNCVSSFSPDRMCIFRADFTIGSSAAPNVILQTCHGPLSTSDSIDGTALTTNGTKYIGAYENTTKHTAEVFGTGAPNQTLAFPSVDDHVIFARSGSPVLIAPQNEGVDVQFNMIALINGAWTQSAPVDNGLYNHAVCVGGSHCIKDDIDYSATWFTPSQINPMLVFFELQQVDFGMKRLQGTICNTTVPWPYPCGQVSGWTTDVNTNSFLGALASEQYLPSGARNPVAEVWLSYWTDSGRTDGSIDLKIMNLNPYNGTIGTPLEQDGANTEVPCPSSSGLYWGDYDQAVFIGNYTGNPVLLRGFNDSTGGTCNPTFGSPSHVSLLANAVH